ncbi:syntaxin-17-like isoform X2 [Dendronephthya gigantea]|uniref:syntaxin-17-like isoform X2 n=1 Tax=Dendronephthya gigantea TaxID=151771 RepID=UPI00106CE0B2|nr:syntaxin-17-like isoform X2 [Dendronephthya gigantea]
MASFEKRKDDSSKKNAKPVQKLPLKRFEPAIYRFSKIAVPTDLDRLERHKYNIEKYVKWKNWSKFDVERINAERTIKQLKANIQDMRTTREQVADNEVAEFDSKVDVASKKALAEISTLQKLIESSQNGRDDTDGSTGKQSLSPTLSDADFPLVPQAVASPHETEPRSSSRSGLQRFDVTLRTFTRITIPTALERLRMHCQNMDKYYRERMWHELNVEQINAGITVQHLKKSIEDIEVLRKRVPSRELAEFDERVGPSYEKARSAIDSFMKFQTKYQHAAPPGPGAAQRIDTKNDGSGTEISGNFVKQEVIPDEATVHSWDDLQKSLVELNDLIHEFSHLVHAQQPVVDEIESNIENAEFSIHEATQELGKAAKLQGMVLPAIGAVVGGVVGGPVGLLAGFKAATVLTAVGGGLIGFKATSYIKNKREEAVDSELEKLTDRNDENEDYDDHS